MQDSIYESQHSMGENKRNTVLMVAIRQHLEQPADDPTHRYPVSEAECSQCKDKDNLASVLIGKDTYSFLYSLLSRLQSPLIIFNTSSLNPISAFTGSLFTSSHNVS